MVNLIMQGISKTLRNEFGDQYRIYRNTVKQGFKQPCFFVGLVNSGRTPGLCRREQREYLFDVRYFSGQSEPTADLLDTADHLFSALEFIPVQEFGILHGTNMNYEIVDEVLHFMLNYNLGLRMIKEPTDVMMELETKGMIESGS